MLRMTPIADAKQAVIYYGKSDGDYYYQDKDTRHEWFGEGAKRLSLNDKPEFEQFERLAHGLDPHTGKPLTAKLNEERLAGWDINVHAPKGVSTAINGGDTRLTDAMWEAAHLAFADMEKLATTRVRKDGSQDDRVTGNLVAFGVGHHETRPLKEDGIPDWHEHAHLVVFNLTHDPVEDQWKAVKFRPIMEQRKLFDRRFNQYFSRNVAELGYEIGTLSKEDGKGGRAYAGWDIKAAPGFEKGLATLNAKHSRRTAEIEQLEAEIVAERKKLDANAPDQLSTVAKDKLGGTSRQKKRKDLTLDDCRAAWQENMTPEERIAVGETIRRAKQGLNPKPEARVSEAMEYAIAHEFQRKSVVDFDDLAIIAMERSMGHALPDDFRREAERQGVLFQGSQTTTRAVLDQEQKILGFARAGKGVFSPLAAGSDPERDASLSGLSEEQAAGVKHVWNSTDQVMLIRGGAGTGKTTMMTPALSHLGAPVVLLAPSADASRTTLRKEGFADADTVAAFLLKPELQERVAGGGIIWVDEAGMLGINDLERLCDVAGKLDARIVLQGDPKQHQAVDRHGNMLNVLEEYASLPVAKLTTIQRQKGDYAQAVAAIRDGQVPSGDAMLRQLGWVVESPGHAALVAEYAKALDEAKPDGKEKSVLVISPTHKDGDILTEELRALRKSRGLITGDEREFSRLKPLGWTDAEKSDSARYSGVETVQFYRNSGKFKAGERVKASELLPHLASIRPENFAVYQEEKVRFAVGDTVRITGNGWDASKKHHLDNGRIDQISGFTGKGDLVLSNGWVVPKDFQHFKHGLVQTSPATQSKTNDIVLVAMNKNSLGAMSAEQAYVSISRGRERGMIFTDMPREELLSAVARGDSRRSATEVFERPAALKPEPKPKAPARPEKRVRQFMEKVRAVYRQVQRKAAELVPEHFREKRVSYGR